MVFTFDQRQKGLEVAYASGLLDQELRIFIGPSVEKAGGSKTKAALLKLQPTYLSRLCKQFGIQ